jgi:regulator of replication initiation timing
MSNSTMIKIGQIIEKEQTFGISSCIEWLQSVSDRDEDCTSLRSSILVIKTYRLLNKSKSRPYVQEQIEHYKNPLYSFPVQKSTQTCSRQKHDPVLNILNEDKSCALNVVIDLADDLNNSIEQEKNLKAENDELKTSLKKRCSARYKLKVKHSEVTSLKNKNRYLKSRIEAKDKLLKGVRYQNVYLRSQNIKQSALLKERMTHNIALSDQIVNLQNELASLRDKMKDEREENEYLRLLIQDNRPQSINLFDEQSRVYTKETQECVYELLHSNVTTSRVSNVIKTALKLVDITPNKVPFVSTVNNMNVQRLLLSQTQLAEELSECESTC